MTDGYAFEGVGGIAGTWTDMSERMTETSDGLAGLSPASFAPSIRSAAEAFAVTWAGLASESSVIASGFADALQTVTVNYIQTDADGRSLFANLDGRLGPAT